MDNLVDQAVEQVAKQMIRSERKKFNDIKLEIYEMDDFYALSDEDQATFRAIGEKILANLVVRCEAQAKQKVLESIIKNVEV